MTDPGLVPAKTAAGTLLLRTGGGCDFDPPHLVEVFARQRHRFTAVLRGFGARDRAAPTPGRPPRPAATLLSGLPASTRPPWGASPTSSTPRLPHLVDTFGRPVMTTPRYPIQPCVRATARARADRPGAAIVTRPASTSGERIKAVTKFKTLS